MFPTDPQRAKRGGSFLCNPNYCYGFRLSARSSSTPESSFFHVGFRCVKNLNDWELKIILCHSNLILTKFTEINNW